MKKIFITYGLLLSLLPLKSFACIMTQTEEISDLILSLTIFIGLWGFLYLIYFLFFYFMKLDKKDFRVGTICYFGFGVFIVILLLLKLLLI